MGGGYEEVGSAEGAVNVNPMTGDILQTLMGQLQAGGQGAEQLINQLGSNDFLSILGDERLQGVIGQFAGERNTLAEQAAINAERKISGSFAGTGLYSGAFGEAVGQGVGQAYQQGATDIAGMQQSLYGQALGIAGQQNIAGLGYYGQMAGGALSGLTAFGMPEYYDPTYMGSSGEWGSAIGGGLTGAATGATIGSAIPVLGTAVGAGIGGLAGLFGGYYS